MRIAVIGAGAVGTRAARHVASAEGVTGVLVADERAERAEGVVASLGSIARRVDGGVEGVVAESVDAAVLALPSGLHHRAARTLLAAGVAVVSTSDSIEDVSGLLDLDPEASARGVPVVVGAGFSPGLTCLLARHAAATLDGVDEVHVAKAGTGGPACAHQHHAALGGSAVDWREGAWLRRRGGSGRELCWFPDPIGGRDCYRAALPDALLLVRAFPGVRRVTARLAANRRDRLSGRLPMLRPPHRDGGLGAVRVEVRGRRGIGREIHVLGAMDHPAVAAGTVAGVAAVQAATRGLLRAGAGGLAELTSPLPVLAELARLGVKAAVFDGAPA